MTSGAHEALEHAEHTHHAAHEGGGFTMVVAMTMAMTAALLAVVTLLSHRSHNETIVCQSEANVKHTKATDQWGFYQAKKIRDSEYEAFTALLPLVAKDPNDAAVAKLLADWDGKRKKYNSDAKNELKDIKATAEKLAAEGEAKMEESEAAHHRSDRYDLGELLVEIALVLCSIAMLAKKKSFLGLAIVIALAGGAIASTGYTGFMMEHHAAAGHEGAGGPKHGEVAVEAKHEAKTEAPSEHR